MPKSIDRDYWSEGGQIFFHHSAAWSTKLDGSPCCLGTEDDVLKALDENKRTGNPVIDNILTIEINSRNRPEPVQRRHK